MNCEIIYNDFCGNMRKEAPKGRVSGLRDPAFSLGVMEMSSTARKYRWGEGCYFLGLFSLFGTDAVKL